MTRITTVSKKVLATIFAMLIAFSCMASAFAEEASRPDAPTGLKTLAVFSDTIVIEAIEGCEYAILAYEDGAVDADKAEYRAATVFEGLEPETKYAVYARYDSTDTTLASYPAKIDVTTDKADADPKVEITDADVKVNHEFRSIECAQKIVEYKGQPYIVKYEISPNTNVDSSDLSNGSVKFGNLVSGTTYTIIGKITIEGIAFKSAPLTKTLKLAQNPPSAPVPTKITSTSIEVKALDKKVNFACIKKGVEEEFVWSTKNTFTDLEPETTYVIYAKYPATDSYLESTPVYVEIDTLKVTAGKAPAPVLLDKNSTSITVGAADSIPTEFSIDGGKTWNKTGLFTGLTPKRKYDVVARYTFDASKQDPSLISQSAEIITNERANYNAQISKCKFNVTSEKVYANNTLSFTITGDTYAGTDQYGDTRYIPVAWSYGDQSGTFEGGKVSVSGSLKTPGSEQDITITVTYELQKFKGTNWVTVDSATSNCKVHVNPEYSPVKAFFESILNFLLDTLPGLILRLFGVGK